MKKVILLFIMAVGCLSMQAQSNLHISPIFDHISDYEKDTKTVWVKGKELKKYKLTLYRSLSTENSQIASDMEKAVMADSRKAADKEIGYIGSRLYFAFLSLPPEAAGQDFMRFIFYRNPSLKNGGKKEVTLVYMEGKITMGELKNLFKK